MGKPKPASQQNQKRGPGRPRLTKMPPIPDTAENILRTVLAGPPREDWRYLEEHEKQKRGQSSQD